MKKFKENWEITQNWQLLFPLIGVLFLGYSSLKLVKLTSTNWFNSADSYFLPYLIASFIFVGIYYFFLKVVLYAIQKLENKWVVDQRWELIRIFIVFAFTGSSSVFVGRPFIKWIGITKEPEELYNSLNPDQDIKSVLSQKQNSRCAQCHNIIMNQDIQYYKLKYLVPLIYTFLLFVLYLACFEQVLKPIIIETRQLNT